jgi:hypothetical protein
MPKGRRDIFASRERKMRIRSVVALIAVIVVLCRDRVLRLAVHAGQLGRHGLAEVTPPTAPVPRPGPHGAR